MLNPLGGAFQPQAELLCNITGTGVCPLVGVWQAYLYRCAVAQTGVQW